MNEFFIPRFILQMWKTKGCEEDRNETNQNLLRFLTSNNVPGNKIDWSAASQNKMSNSNFHC